MPIQPGFDRPANSPVPPVLEFDHGFGHSGARWMVAVALGLMMLGLAFSL